MTISIREMNDSLGRQTVLTELIQEPCDLLNALKRVFNKFEQTKGMEVLMRRELNHYNAYSISFYFPKSGATPPAEPSNQRS